MKKFCNGKNKGLALLDPFFPNRSLLLGFSSGSKRGLPENTHKACSGHCGRPARGREGTLKIRRVLPSKSKFKLSFWQTEKFATVKIRVWRFWTHFPIVLKWPSKKMFCWLIFVHAFTCTMNRIKESNEWIESMNGSNESNQWIESTNRINESNHWVERQDKKLWLYTSGDFLNRF